MFRGINALMIDGKGRFAIPTRYRVGLGEHVVVTIDTEEPCLLIYPAAVWQEIENNLQKLPSFNPQARRIQRLLIGHATDVQCDASNRLLLPPLLREYAKLDKQIVLIGQGNKFELWNEENWQMRREEWLGENMGDVGLPDEMKSFFL